MRLAVLVMGILVATLTLAGVGQAQGVIAVHGVIQSVDCQTSALVLSAADGTHVYPAGPSTTVFVNSIPMDFCTLQQFIGSGATVSVGAYGDQLVAERVDVYGATAPVAPVSPPPVYTGISPLAGVILGTIAVAGLVWLLIRTHDGREWRVPYDRWPRYTRERPVIYQPVVYQPYRPGWQAPADHPSYERHPQAPAYRYDQERRPAPAYRYYQDRRPAPAYQSPRGRHQPAPSYRQYCPHSQTGGSCDRTREK
jgi:hypothetical protein